MTRLYSVLEYTEAGHRQLLIRSRPGDERNTRIDVLFKGVAYVRMPTEIRLEGIDEVGPEDVPALGDPVALRLIAMEDAFAQKRKAFRLRSPEGDGLVIAFGMVQVEDHGLSGDPTSLPVIGMRWGPVHSRLEDSDPDLAASIVTADEGTQLAVAQAAAEFAVSYLDEPIPEVSRVLSSLQQPNGVDQSDRQSLRRISLSLHHALTQLHADDTVEHRLEHERAWARAWAASAVLRAAGDDPLEAALEATFEAGTVVPGAMLRLRPKLQGVIDGRIGS